MPTNAVLYWRDNSTRTALTAFDTLDKLIAAKPLQVIVFNSTNTVLTSVSEAEEPNVSEDPVYDASGGLVIEKQFNGTFGYTQVLNIKSDTDQTAFRTKLRSFARKIPIEPAFHEFGIFGFFHPIVTDFNVDPIDDFGYTIDQPTHDFQHGAETVYSRITLRIGGHVDLIP